MASKQNNKFRIIIVFWLHLACCGEGAAVHRLNCKKQNIYAGKQLHVLRTRATRAVFERKVWSECRNWLRFDFRIRKKNDCCSLTNIEPFKLAGRLLEESKIPGSCVKWQKTLSPPHPPLPPHDLKFYNQRFQFRWPVRYRGIKMTRENSIYYKLYLEKGYQE